MNKNYTVYFVPISIKTFILAENYNRLGNIVEGELSVVSP